ncbi:hypothetical protein ABTM39_20215, partial [Acinetobacter baumannii]
CRANLVKDKPGYLARMDEFAAGADLIKMSDVDFAYLFGDEPHQERAEALLRQGTALVVITRGQQGGRRMAHSSRTYRGRCAAGR